MEEEGGGFFLPSHWLSLQDLLLHHFRPRCTTQFEAVLLARTVVTGFFLHQNEAEVVPS